MLDVVKVEKDELSSMKEDFEDGSLLEKLGLFLLQDFVLSVGTTLMFWSVLPILQSKATLLASSLKSASS